MRRYGADAQAYGMAVGMLGRPSCEDDAVRQLVEVRRKAAEWHSKFVEGQALSMEEEEELLQVRRGINGMYFDLSYLLPFNCLEAICFSS